MSAAHRLELEPLSPILHNTIVQVACRNPGCAGTEALELTTGALECRNCHARWMPIYREPPAEPLLWEGDQA